MKRIFLRLLRVLATLLTAVGMAVYFYAAFAIGTAEAQNAKLYRAEASVPEVVSIRATMPDSARVCVEPPGGGLVSCRSIGELRKWITERQAK